MCKQSAESLEQKQFKTFGINKKGNCNIHTGQPPTQTDPYSKYNAVLPDSCKYRYTKKFTSSLEKLIF